MNGNTDTEHPTTCWCDECGKRAAEIPALTENGEETGVLDWRDLAPEPEQHECDCGYCDMGGDLEPVKWPLLIVADGDGVDYVTDRFMMIRSDRAPIPEGYEGTVLPDRPNASDLLASLAGVSPERPAPDQHFRWTVLKALALTGWDLRVIRGSDRRVAVVDRDGQPIGVAIASLREVDSEWSADFTRPYSDHRFPPEGGTS